MTKVFAITKGSYSDYSIVGVFSSKAKAQRALDNLSFYDKNDYIEEYELDELDTLVNKFARGYAIYYVSMSRDGTVNEAERIDDIDIWFNHNKNNGNVWAHVLAKSDKHAVKIVNEKRAQLIASGEL